MLYFTDQREGRSQLLPLTTYTHRITGPVHEFEQSKQIDANNKKKIKQNKIKSATFHMQQNYTDRRHYANEAIA